MFEAIARRKVFEEVAERIRHAIEAGRYGAGDALPSERELMEAFKVGRPAVRDALLVLQTTGLVTIQHGRPARVADPFGRSLQQRVEAIVGRLGERGDRLIPDIQEARLALEVAMARRAAELSSAEAIERLSAALEANRLAIHERDGYLQTDIAFHRTIASITGNVIFEESAAAILEWLARFRNDLVHVEGANLLSHDEHVAIANAISVGNADAAADAMRRHQLRTHGLYKILTTARPEGGQTNKGGAAREDHRSRAS